MIMVFSDNEMVKFLQSSPLWLANGTVKLSPKMFYQLYTDFFCRSSRMQFPIRFLAGCHENLRNSTAHCYHIGMLLLFITYFLPENRRKNQFSRKLQSFSERIFNTLVRTISGFYFSPSCHPDFPSPGNWESGKIGIQ